MLHGRAWRWGLRIWVGQWTASLEIDRPVHFSEMYGYQRVYRLGRVSFLQRMLPR